MDLRFRLRGFWECWRYLLMFYPIFVPIMVFSLVFLRDRRIQVISDYLSLMAFAYLGGIEYLVDPENAERIGKNLSDEYD